MQHRTLGSSGVLVSPICLGTMTYGSPVNEADSIKLTHAAIDLGINFIDTANSYEGYDRVLGSAGGTAERILGKALKDKRENVVLATKVGSPLGPGPNDRGLSAATILRELDASLERLATDYVDLYIIHWPDKDTPLDETLGAMDIAVKQGKIRYFGVSNHSASQLCEFLWIAEKTTGPRVVASQIPYSMLKRDFHNDLAFCEKHHIAVTPYQPIKGGLLTGKYQRGQGAPDGSRAAEKPEWVGDIADAVFDQLEAIAALADEAGTTMTRYALAWTLAQPAMASLVLGVKRIEQVEDALAALDVTIPDEHFAKIDEICPPPWRQIDPIRGM